MNQLGPLRALIARLFRSLASICQPSANSTIERHALPC